MADEFTGHRCVHRVSDIGHSDSRKKINLIELDSGSRILLVACGSANVDLQKHRLA